ncbi:MAG: hypothetical protein ACRC7N_04885 [Clostridium sp.]
MAISVKYQKNIRGVVAMTGNTIAIKTTLNTSAIYNTQYMDISGTPIGTTNLSGAGSIAPFFLPDNSYVEYAELLTSSQGTNANRVDFITPTGTIANLNLPTSNSGGYGSTSAIVTTIVRNAGSGYYGITNAATGSSLYSGWILCIVYSNPDFPLRNCYLSTGAANAGSTTQISNILTPTTGPCNAAVVIAASQTDYFDQTKAYIGHTTPPTIPLGNPTPITLPWDGNKPFAPQAAFLAPIICNGNLTDPNFSLLETRGTAGEANFHCYDGYLNSGITTIPTKLIQSICSQNIVGKLSNNKNTVYLSTSTAASTDIAYGLMVDLNQAQMKVTKIVDKDYSSKGGTLLYTITVENIGQVNANEVVLFDTLTSGQLDFVAGTVTVNGASTGENPTTGISLGNGIAPFNPYTITFQAILSNTLTSGSGVNNFARTNYSFLPGAGLATIVDFAISNVVTTTIISSGNISLTKSVDKAYSLNKEILTYTIVVANTGDYTCTGIVFSDTIPTSTSFIPNSLFVDGVSQGGSPNPPGINLPDMVVGAISTISFKVLVSTQPSSSIINQSTSTFEYYNGLITLPSASISNNVITNINYVDMITNKAVNKSYAELGQILTYTITINNIGNTITNGLVFIDTTPNGTTFVGGSLKENGLTISGDPNPPGITLNNILPNGVTTLSFDINITSLPSPNPILNSGTFNSSFILNPITGSVITQTYNTNIVATTISYVDLSGIKKLVNKEYSKPGDTITYTIIIPNTGNIQTFNVRFIDTIPTGTVLENNSVTVNGITQSGVDLGVGITLPNINAGEIVTIVYSVLIL